MEFNSVTYILFLLIILVLFYSVKRNLRVPILLLSSFLFYISWSIPFSALLIISAITDFLVSNRIFRSKSFRIKKLWLTLSLIVNLGLLIYFKYLMFLAENTFSILEQLGYQGSSPALDIMLPFGISFYTFETISYSVDVYRGILKPERNFWRYGLFVAFFPKLIAGPIQRAGDLLPQFSFSSRFSWVRVKLFLKRILFGLFLKVVLADSLSPMVDSGFASEFALLSVVDIMTLGVLFGLQIYFDFAAYSSIAIGTAGLFGIDIPENFNFPYSASSFRSFWKRWHISLSSWIRDYLYLPLTGVKVYGSSSKTGIGESFKLSRNRNYALFLTWIIMGFWHGANWNFALWGLIHSVAIYSERLVQKVVPDEIISMRFWKISGWIITMTVLAFSWVIFRVEGIDDMLTVLCKFLVPENLVSLNLRENNYLVAFTFVILMFLWNWLHETQLPFVLFLKNSFFMRVVFYTLVTSLVYIFFDTKAQFIYFQF